MKRTCSNCEIEKNLEDFYRRKDGSYRMDCKRCLLDYQMIRCKARKLKAVELFGSKCSNCGYCKNLAALDFHHLDPQEKEFVWRELQKRPWDQVVCELKKCTLLCKNCHAEEHNPGLELNLIDGNCANRSLTKDRFITVSSTGLCLICNKEVFGTKFCSTKCSQKAARKVKRPTKEQLAAEIDSMSWVAIGRKYNVSDNAVRKWAKYYGLKH